MKSHSSSATQAGLLAPARVATSNGTFMGAKFSLYSRARSLLGGRLLLTTSLQELMGGLCLATEVVVVREQLLEVHCLFVEKHTGDDWGCLVSEGSLDGAVNVVSDEGLSILTLELVETRHINLPWEPDHGLLLLGWLWLPLHLLMHHLIWILHHLGWLSSHHTWLLSGSWWLGHSLWSAVIIVLLVALGLVNKVLLPLRLLTLLRVLWML